MARGAGLGLSLLLVWGGLSTSEVRAAGRIVVANDEWTLTNTGFQRSSDSGRFILNVLSWFKPDGPGKFHAYSTNPGLIGSTLARTVTEAGHTWTTGLGIPATLESFLAYDAILLAANPVDNDLLIDYVRQGGNIYLAAGTAFGVELKFQEFLNTFGLKLDAGINDVEGSIPIESPHPIFKDVHALYQNSGNDVLMFSAVDPHTVIPITYEDHGLYGIFDGSLTWFRRGDADQDGTADITDAISILGYLFVGAPRPLCLDSADCDDNGALEITDPICLLSYLFTGGSDPAVPGPTMCGPDLTADEMEECVYAAASCAR